MNRRRRALAHVAAAARPEPAPAPLVDGLLGFWALDGNAGADEPELAGAAAGGTLGCDFTEDATDIGIAAGPGSHAARSFNNLAALTLFGPNAAFASLPLTLNFWAKYPVEFDGGVGSLPWSWNCGAMWGPPFSAYYYAGVTYVTARDVDAGGVMVANYQTAYCDDAWHMWTIVLDESWNLSIYIDGELGTDFEPQEVYAPPAGGVLQGELMDSLSFGNSKYNGALNGSCGAGHAMALLGIWSRVLTASDVAQLYNGGDGLGFSEF
jgi:hypothetical protein